jgi:hypothetical protein
MIPYAIDVLLSQAEATSGGPRMEVDIGWFGGPVVYRHGKIGQSPMGARRTGKFIFSTCHHHQMGNSSQKPERH